MLSLAPSRKQSYSNSEESDKICTFLDFHRSALIVLCLWILHYKKSSVQLKISLCVKSPKSIRLETLIKLANALFFVCFFCLFVKDSHLILFFS